MAFRANLLTLILALAANARDLPNPLSIGGNYIRRGDCPWLCPLYLKQSPQDKYFCGSSLLTSKYVVTAAHCVRAKKSNYVIEPQDVYAFAGKFNLEASDESDTEKIFANLFKIHPTWNTTSERFDGDVALIRLRKEVIRSQFLDKIALPTSGYEFHNGFVVGYGKSETSRVNEIVPRRIEIPVVDSETCYQSNKAFGDIKSRAAFCAGRPGVAPCNGDSGSSFYAFAKNSQPVLLGVVSTGLTNSNFQCNDQAYVLFADVRKFVDWIKDEVDSGYLTIDTGNTDADSVTYDRGGFDKVSETLHFKANPAICTYVPESEYRCDLKNVEAFENNVKITTIRGSHVDDKDDRDVVKVWIVDQDSYFIPEMSNVVAKFKKIKDFRIWSSGLEHIERYKLSVFGTKLTTLDFFNNRIEKIPEDAFNDLHNLEQLILNKNMIKRLPANLFKNLRKLTYLFAEYNEIKVLPAQLFASTKIAHLVLNHNQLKTINVDFKRLHSVVLVDLLENACINRCFGHYCSRNPTTNIDTVTALQELIHENCKSVNLIQIADVRIN